MINRITTRKQKLEEKQLYGYFKRQTREISYENSWIWLWKGIFKRDFESILISAKNNAIRTNYIQAKIDKTTK